MNNEKINKFVQDFNTFHETARQDMKSCGYDEVEIAVFSRKITDALNQVLCSKN